MSNPLIFISHKHSDRKIAETLAAFFEERSNGRVRIFLSSNPKFEGPRFGKNLNSQLRDALWETDVFLLVYTTADTDWSYCMYECGLATVPNSPRTDVIVFQCGTDVPSPFKDSLRVNVRSADDLYKFTDQFLRDPVFIPRLQGSLAPDLKDALVQRFAAELHEALGKVIPPPGDGQIEEWPAWPYLRIELPRGVAAELEAAPEKDRATLARKIVVEQATVIDNDARASQIFGRASLPAKMKFATLLEQWIGKYPGEDAAWFDSCCDQIMTGALRNFPVIQWSSMTEIGGDTKYTPVLSRVRHVPFAATIQFDLYFYDLVDPRAIPVSSKMIALGDMYYKNLGTLDPTTLPLRDLTADLDASGRNRVPIFDANLQPLYVIHRSVIDRFVAKCALANGTRRPADLTLADLLGDPEMRKVFEGAFAVVRRQATLAEARAAMVARPGCSDVFVTAGGTPGEPVQGWLTNVDFVQSS